MKILVGASPEVMVRVEDGEITVRPIAGTYPRGTQEMEDRAIEQALLADPKEIAEHVMLLDLGRNDVGRVAATGSVEVTERMVIERYAHVMHIVSNVRGRLRPDRDCFDAFRATFPAGTLSGAPKIRAMEIIEELEPVRRGVFRELENPFQATRYHSLVIDPATLPADLEVSAWTEEGEIMGVRHRSLPIEGVQFHPESILTLEGKRLLQNFLGSLPSR
jgi:hypothetical protein